MQWIHSSAQRLGVFRRPVGLFFFILAVLGFVLPILPSWPFIVPAVVLLGPRDPLIRKSHLLLRHCLRWMRRSRSPLVRAAGLRFLDEYLRAKRLLGPMIRRSLLPMHRMP